MLFVALLMSANSSDPHASTPLTNHTASSRIYGSFVDSNCVVNELTFAKPSTNLPIINHVSDRPNWAVRMWSRFKPCMRDRLLRNVQRMILMSRFSGIGGFECVLYVIVCMLNLMVEQPIASCPCSKATEQSKSRQAVLRSFKNNSGPQCLFNKLHERLPHPVLLKCLETEPDALADKAEKRASYLEIDET